MSESQQDYELRPFYTPDRTCLLCVVSLSCALVGLAGWLFHMPALTTILPGLPSMKFNTALCMLLLTVGTGLFPFRRYIPHVLGFAAATIALLTFIEYQAGFNFGIDEFVRPDVLNTGSVYPGRMGMTSAICFTLLGIALCLPRSRTASFVAHLLQVVAGTISLAALFGYLITWLWPDLRTLFTQMALHTSIGTSTIAIAGLLRRPPSSVSEILTSKGRHRLQIKLLVPTVLVAAPIFAGGIWIILSSIKSAAESQAFASAESIVASLDTGIRTSQSRQELDHLVDAIGRNPNVREIFILDQAGETIISAKPMQWIGKNIESVASSFDLQEIELAKASKQSQQKADRARGLFVTLVEPLEYDSPNANVVAKSPGYLLICYDAKDLAIVVGHAGQVILVVTAISLIFMVAMAWWLLRRALLVPLSRINSVVARREAGDTAVRVDNSQPDEVGQLAVAINSLFDAADQAQTENERLALVSRLTHNAVVLCHADQSIIWANEAFLNIVNERADDVLGRPVLSMFHFAESQADRGQEIESAFEAGKPHSLEVMVTEANHQNRWLDIEIQPILTDDGFIDGWIVIEVDVTDRKNAELHLAATMTLLEAFVEHAPAAVAMFDTNMRYLAHSRRWLSDYGLKDQNLVGRNHYDVFPTITDRWREIHSRCLEGSVETSAEDLFERENGLQQWLRWEVRPWHNSEGEIGGILMLTEDITARKYAAEALREAHEAAKAASRSKSEFLANMSHEIRTPMTAILGYADLLSENDRTILPTQRVEYIETIKRNGEHLLSIINDILDLSKIESGKMTVEHTETNPMQVVEEVLSLLNVRAAGKGISLSSRITGAFPKEIKSDPVRVRQILMNLVGNAIKFTEVGGVTLSVRLDDADRSHPKLLFTVRDTGIGMSPDQVSRMFRAFEQADTSTTRRFGGTGLGLLISKRFAEMLGGDITVTSEVGKGSEFVFYLPTEPISELDLLTAKPSDEVKMATGGKSDSSLVPPQTYRLNGIRILLVEDGPDNQRLIATRLRRGGAMVEIAENGKLAIEALTVDNNFDSPLLDPPPFDLVLMDMQMPVMDGYTAVRHLRHKGCTLPIVALTAHAMTGDEKKCLSAGCNDYATKPIDKVVLIDTCLRVLHMVPTLDDSKAAPASQGSR